MRQKIELFTDRKGAFRWRLLSSKRVIATSEGYSKKSGAKQGIKSAVKAFSGGTLEESPVPIIDLTLKAIATKSKPRA